VVVTIARHYVSPRYPETPQDLAAVLADPYSASELFGSTPAAWSDFETHYAAASPGIRARVAEQAQLETQRAFQAAGGIPRGLAGNGRPSRNRLYNAHAPGVQLDQVIEGREYPFADLAKAFNRKDDTERAVALRTQMSDATFKVYNAMSERVPAEGGFLLPEVLRSQMLQFALENSVIRQRAHVVTMDSLRVPFPMIDDTSHASSVYGGVQGFWAEEGAALTASAPSFGRQVLQAEKLTLYTTIPNELLADAGPTLQDWLNTSWPRALSWFEDLAFITGSGVGEPQGFLNAPAAIKVSTTTDNVITWTDLIKAYIRFLPQSLTSPGTVWLCSPDTREQLLLLAMTPQSVTSSPQPVAPPAWLTGFQAIDGLPSTLFGHPLLISEKMPSSLSGSTAGALSLVDLQFYLIGDRQSVHIAVSDEYLFANDMQAWRMLERVAGRIWIQSAITPYNGGSSLSPVVLIDTTT